MPTAWIILLRVLWVGLLLFSGVVTLFMLAFADSPGAGKVAQKMFRPILVFTLFDFAASGWLLMHGAWWGVVIAFLMVLLPPVMVFLGYRVLMR